MNDCLRELWLIAAIHDFELRAVHLEGQSNRAADLLSRWQLNISNCVTLNAQFRGRARGAVCSRAVLPVMLIFRVDLLVVHCPHPLVLPFFLL